MQNSKLQFKSQKGFSILLILVPLTLIIFGAIFFASGYIGKNQPNLEQLALKTSPQPPVLDTGCNDPYNADCADDLVDDEGDSVTAQDLIGP